MSLGLTPAELLAFLQSPAAAPPPGQVANFVNPPDQAQQSRRIVEVCIFLPTVVVALKLYTRACILRRLGPDDWILLLAWAVYMTYAGLCLHLLDLGIGRHQWDTRLGQAQDILYYTRVTTIIYGVVTPLQKSAILLQFISLFNPKGNRTSMFWSCWTVMITIILFYISCTLAEIFVCHPIEKFWMPWLPKGHCINYKAIDLITGVFNSLTDIIILVLPIKSIWQLQLSRDKKIKASSIFLVGLFAVVASIVRMGYSIIMLTTEDQTWNLTKMVHWTYAEITATFYCACAPSLPPLFKYWSPRIKSFTTKHLKQRTNSTASSSSSSTWSQKFREKAAMGFSSDSPRLQKLPRVYEKFTGRRLDRRQPETNAASKFFQFEKLPPLDENTATLSFYASRFGRSETSLHDPVPSIPAEYSQQASRESFHTAIDTGGEKVVQ